MTDRIRVVLADDHPIVLAGIRALLNADPEIELVGEATSGSDALPMICSSGPDVAVVDVSMPGLNGLELAERVAGECPQTRVLVLTVHEDAAYVQPLLKAGARGYLLKRSAADDLLRAVRAVAAGGVYLDPSIAAMP
jgi:DNA-binding NarL/FixJ family response regulator